MKSIKPSTVMFSLMLFALFAGLTLFGQTNVVTNAVAPPLAEGVPSNPVGWVELAITVLTPLVIAGIKAFAPKIPRITLPFIAPVIGLALQWLSTYVTGHPTELIAGAVFGGLGVWLREIVDQTKLKVKEKAEN